MEQTHVNLSWLHIEFKGHFTTLAQIDPWGVKPSLQTQDDVSFTILRIEFYGQTIFMQVLLVSSHLKPLSQRHDNLSLFGDEFKGH